MIENLNILRDNCSRPFLVLQLQYLHFIDGIISLIRLCPVNRSTSAESMNGPQSPESYTSNSPASVCSDATTTSNSNSISNGGFPVTQFSFTPEGWFDEPPRVSVPGAKCQVCGELAGKHSAYGGRVCPSCRAFFRRSVQTKYFEIFACSKGEKCTITLSSRKTCKYCRFKKCLQVRFQSTKFSNFSKKHPFPFKMLCMNHLVLKIECLFVTFYI